MAVLLIASIKHAKIISPAIRIRVVSSLQYVFVSSPALFEVTLEITLTSLKILKIKCVFHVMLNLLNFIQLRLLHSGS